jgi:hypothetical protein
MARTGTHDHHQTAAAGVAGRAAVAASFTVLGHLHWLWIPAAVLLEEAGFAPTSPVGLGGGDRPGPGQLARRRGGPGREHPRHRRQRALA